jgi:hydroxymethylbilane synthase
LDKARWALRSARDEKTFAAVRAERALLLGLGGGCQVPIGAQTSISPRGRIKLTGFVAELDGSLLLRATEEGPKTSAEKIGARLAKRLMKSGAKEILERVEMEAAKAKKK